MLLALLTACQPPLGPGEWGTVRWFAELDGAPPMSLLPPLSDRDGNVYVLQGSREPERVENAFYVGHHLGGWSEPCTEHEGTFGVHGWVGRDDSRAWAWSGDALVEIDEFGACRSVLDRDPDTATDLKFVAVAPWVRDTPTRTTAVAMVKGAGDPYPWFAQVDLQTEQLQNLTPFDVSEDLRVLGTGANATLGQAWFLVAWDEPGGVQTHMLTVDAEGDLSSDVALELDAVPEYAVLGFLQAGDDGTAVGLLEDGRLVGADESGGGAWESTTLDVEGLYTHGGRLYLTGMVGSMASRAGVNGVGDVDPPSTWDAAEEAAGGLLGEIVVLDERSSPAERIRWSEASSAIGSAPLLSPWPLDVYTLDSTGWMVAGPSYQAQVSEYQTAVAFAPVGVLP